MARQTLARKLATLVRLERQLLSLEGEPMSEKGQSFYKRELAKTTASVDKLVDDILEGEE